MGREIICPGCKRPTSPKPYGRVVKLFREPRWCALELPPEKQTFFKRTCQTDLIGMGVATWDDVEGG